jgi:hypothetical protein
MRARLRLTLPDAATWPDATLDGWLADALRFYSAEFPRAVARTVTLEAGQRTVDLPDGCLGVTGVIYPAATNPPRYLAQCGSERDGLFRAGGAAYVLRAAPESATAPGILALAETPAEAETLEMVCLEARAAPEDDSDPVDAPAAHLEALVAFCEFRAHWERETGAALSAEIVSMTVAQLGENARRAWNRYRETIDRLRWLTGGDAAVVGWGAACG